MTNRQESAAALRWFRWMKKQGNGWWIRWAIKRGDAKERSPVGWILEFEATNKQASAAVLWYFKWVKRMAKQGNAEAQCRVGQIFDVGRRGLVCVDDAEEVKWWRKAAEQGHLRAQLALGWAYYDFYENVLIEPEYEEGVAEAVKWFRKAAEQGAADAQEKLGWMYCHGFGVPQDKEEAVKWCRKAAEQGDAQAQETLGMMSEDEVEGYAWYLLADANGIYCGEEISDLEERLTVKQGKKGQARAAELRRLIEERKENPKPSVESP